MRYKGAFKNDEKICYKCLRVCLPDLRITIWEKTMSWSLADVWTGVTTCTVKPILKSTGQTLRFGFCTSHVQLGKHEQNEYWNKNLALQKIAKVTIFNDIPFSPKDWWFRKLDRVAYLLFPFTGSVLNLHHIAAICLFLDCTTVKQPYNAAFPKEIEHISLCTYIPPVVWLYLLNVQLDLPASK